jgi:hypothetical protein
VTKKDTIPWTARHPRKMELKTQTWFQKRISKICVNLCTLAQTANLPVPSLGPHPRDYTGLPMQMVVPALHPPYSSTGQSYTCNTTISKSRNTTTPHYSASRVSAMLDSQLQKTVTSHCSAVRTHATSDRHTLARHYSLQ